MCEVKPLQSWILLSLQLGLDVHHHYTQLKPEFQIYTRISQGHGVRYYSSPNAFINI